MEMRSLKTREAKRKSSIGEVEDFLEIPVLRVTMRDVRRQAKD
jgi:hypothetical protein